MLDDNFLFDLVLEEFSDEPTSEYDSYRKIPKELREKILNWLRKQKYYYEELLGVPEEKQEVADTGLLEVDDLERRISNLEDVFKQLKEKEGKEGKEGKG